MMSWEYIAGFFDGDGCISYLHKNQSNIYWRVLISQKDRNILDIIQKFIGYGKVYKVNKSPILYQYVIVKQQQVMDFLKKVSPYVIVKRKKLQTTLNWMMWQKSAIR